MAESMVEVDKQNHSFYQDFFGFSSEEWSRNTTSSSPNSPESFSSRPSIPNDSINKQTEMVEEEETNPMFRSSSGSFRYMRFKIASERRTSRSMSVTAVMERSRMVSKSKSRWQVFMLGFGSGKFPTKMDLSDIKIRQLRRQSTTEVVKDVLSVGGGRREQSGGRRSGKKGWWRLVDVLGCGGGYERDTTVL